MKKILGLSIAVLLVTGLVVGGTLAYFSDTETSTGNVFKAGTIDLEVNDENPWVSTIDAAWGDYKPDQTIAAAQITLENVGTNPMDVWMKITKTATGDGTTTEPETVEEGATAKNDIDTVIRYALSVGGTPKIAYTNNYTISTNATLGTTGIDGYYIWIGNIAAAGTLTVDQNFKMDAGTTNWAQGDDMTFTIEFYAQQSEGDTQPAAPTTELTGYARS
jgi:predicted ribosomally synthesized peptide with SipW-like signal peptide